MPRPSKLHLLAELHGALAGAHGVTEGQLLDNASYLLGVAAALTWVEGIDVEPPIARLQRIAVDV